MTSDIASPPGDTDADDVADAVAARATRRGADDRPDAAPLAVEAKRRKKWVRPALAILLLVSILGVLHVAGLTDDITIENVRAFAAKSGWWGPVAYFFIMATSIALGVPGTIFVLGGMVAFGQVLGPPLTLSAATAGCGVGVWWFRRVGGSPLQDTERPLLQRAIALLERRPILAIAAMRLVLMLSPAAIAILAFAGVRHRDNVAGTALGLLPWVVLATLLTETLVAFVTT